MQSESRTSKSIKNSSVALIFYFINLVLQFFSRKIFLDYLGMEVLGLNTMATNLLQVINLAELGIGSAVSFSLYKPLYNKDQRTINEIIALQGKLYRRIAGIVIAGSIVLMCFFPWIFAKMALPPWYAYASFGVLLFSSLLSYFANYRQVLLSADQKDYKIQYSFKGVLLAKVLVQIVAVKYFVNGYVWWLILEVVFAIVASYTLDRTVRHAYPFISSCRLSLKALDAKYPVIKIKVKQIFVHKICDSCVNAINSVLTYTFASLTMVAIYGNYMLIVLGLISLIVTAFRNISGSIGNLCAEKDVAGLLSIYDELFSVRFMITSTCSFGFLILAPQFITLWVGQEYLLPESSLLLLTAILFAQDNRQLNEIILEANGMFSDVWAPVAKLLLNILLSACLGYFYGLNGVLSGSLISLVAINLCWKPVYLFVLQLHVGLWSYAKLFIKHIVIAGICMGCLYVLLPLLPFNPAGSLGSFVGYALLSVGCFLLLFLILSVVCRCGVLKFLRRIKSFAK